jgi:hypothetical protein
VVVALGPRTKFGQKAPVRSGKSPELMDRRTLALFCANSPDDVHYPVWEMHPKGDELLILASRLYEKRVQLIGFQYP